ncbi:hypothetical protein ACI78V_19145 [Geodermatophilus sp. SYSU D00742]
MRTSWRYPAAIVPVAVALSGCASLETRDVGAVAAGFEDPTGDPAQRCSLLAPAALAALESEASAPCEDALADVPLPGGAVESVEVWGGNAQVRLSGDTVFLAETGTGWKVVAAGCRPRAEAPYDCEVEGP